MEDHYLERVQKGLREVFLQGGTAYSAFTDVEYTAAGKTGTAQSYHYEPVKDESGEIIRDKEGNVEDYERIPVENLTLVGYAPYENPEIAFAVVVPDTGVISGGGYQYQTNKEIGRGYILRLPSLKTVKSGFVAIVHNSGCDLYTSLTFHLYDLKGMSLV